MEKKYLFLQIKIILYLKYIKFLYTYGCLSAGDVMFILNFSHDFEIARHGPSGSFEKLAPASTPDAKLWHKRNAMPIVIAFYVYFSSQL